ncbi:MAG: DEAD/DEAH box helicase [Anaerolineae bacterium]
MAELFYHLNQEIIEKKYWMTLEIALPKGGYPLSRSALLEGLDGKDRAHALLLIEEELHFLKLHKLGSSSPSFHKFHVASARSNEVLKKLAASGKLLWQGKKLFVDPFTVFDFFYELEAQDLTLVVRGKLKRGDDREDFFSFLKSSDWIFPGDPPWIVKEGVVRFFKDAVDWSDLSFVYPEPKVLEGDAKELFSKKILEEDASKVIWKEGSQPLLSESREPLPFLQLRDRSGAFADLWMDYGPQGKVAFHEETVSSWRLFQSEKAWEKDLLETDFIKKIVGTSHYYCPMDKVSKSLTFLLEIGWRIIDHEGRSVERQTCQDIDLMLQEGGCLVCAKLRYGEHQADITQVLGAFNRRERFVQLSPSTIGLLDHEALQTQWGELIDEEIVQKSDGMTGIRIKKSHFGLLSDFLERKDVAASSEIKEILSRMDSSVKLETALPADSFSGSLRCYQQEGVDWLAFLHQCGFHGLLADEMGLGKTVQILAFFSRLKHSDPILVVMPTSLLFHWRKELEKFLPSDKVYLHSGKKRVQSKAELQEKRWVLTSYAILRQDASFLVEIPFSAVILDEAQAIKNFESLTHSICCRLQAEFRLAITGTPVENRLEDLWSLFFFLIPELLGDRAAFSAEAAAGGSDARHLHLLKKKVRPFILRRSKEEVAKDLPPKLIQTVLVDMDEGQREVYEEWLSKMRRGLLKKVELEGASSCRMQILEVLLRLRQICCHPLLVDGSLSSEKFSSAKLDALLADLENAVALKRKVLIYSQFTTMLALIEREVQQRGWNYLYLDGSTKDREGLVDTFQKDPQALVFLISLKAGGVGLNLTAADYVFLFDPWWNQAVEEQAIDRAHRIGRQAPLIARRYITALSVEEKIMRLKEHKTSLSKGLLDFDEGRMDLSAQDLLALLST